MHRGSCVFCLVSGLLLIWFPLLGFGASLIPDDPLHTLNSTPIDQSSVWSIAGSTCTNQLDPAQAWTLTDVVNRALCENPQTRETWASTQQQAAQLGISKAPYLPSINFSGTESRSKATLDNSFTRGPTQNQFNPALTLNYLLFDFGARRAAVESVTQRLLAADWTHNETLQTVMLSAIKAYYQTFATQESVTATTSAEKSALAAYDAARYRHKVGAAALSDELQARTAYSQAHLNRQKAEGDARLAEGTLANVLGLDADTSVKLAPPVLVEPITEETQSLHDLIEAAKAARPDLAAAEAKVKADRAGVRQAKANSLPTFPLFANYGYHYYSNSINNSHDWSVGISINVPLFTGYADHYKIRAAEASLESSQATKNRLVQQVSFDVWNAYQNLQTALRTYTSSTDLLDSSTEAERVALDRYKLGAGSILDLLTAQANLANAQLQHIQAQFGWYTSRAALAQALGRLQPSTLHEVTEGH
jgi:outer membrane protein